MKKLGILNLTLAACVFAANPNYAGILNAFQYRNLGPWRTGAWITALAVPETPAKAHRHTMFAGARNGGRSIAPDRNVPASEWMVVTSITSFSESGGKSAEAARAHSRPSRWSPRWRRSGPPYQRSGEA